jgi:radical SAM protein with 4Fe4S-binding SPASM domain
MDLGLFEHILHDLSSLGIRNVELSGGGEPLEHPQINQIIELMDRYNDRINFGLLSNGLNLDLLDENSFKSLMKNCAYIRLSYSEAIQHNPKLRERYLHNLQDLLEYKQKEGYDVRIGAKILITRENTDQILDLTRQLDDLGVEHLKIKSVRSPEDEPTLDDVLKLEKRLYGYKYTPPVKNIIHIDVRKTDYPQDFHCWINPISSTIDPYGDIFLCYNYHNDPKNMSLGSYTKRNSLTDFWGNKDHLEKIQNMDLNKVCKASNACNCRFKDYQNFLEMIIMKYDSNVDKLYQLKIMHQYHNFFNY